jgi:hypothetical protein
VPAEDVPAIETSYKARDVEGFLDIHFYRKIGFQLALLVAKLGMTPSPFGGRSLESWPGIFITTVI